jgi:hypothetical protein
VLPQLIEVALALFQDPLSFFLIPFRSGGSVVIELRRGDDAAAVAKKLRELAARVEARSK